ncbi:hypothetical protein [Streptomyces longisporoflavus]|uniref:Biopolymer transporter Tol n=1 Tax=Streptomyces longisporoflavus TaxID=28044 RepID=A0ABW7QUN5_9ACTN|nr:hypothetical protein [Streptomyces longisporoflavus]GGV28540.1 hypothetical protein GCM10010277_10740 [Streptomyces longisporoflavus]
MAAEDMQYTDDGHFVVIKGRRWRATDPRLPAGVEERLTRHLMSARRAVAAAGDDEAARKAARARVQLAKTGLGERGTPWWEQTLAERRRRWNDCLRQLEER